MPGPNDIWPWLQSILQNQGAGQPVDPNAIPAAAPQAMPGSGLNGMPAVTPGQPSMGYSSVWGMRHGMPDNPLGGLFGGVLDAASQGQPTDAGDLAGAGDTSVRPGPSPSPRISVLSPGAAAFQGRYGTDDYPDSTNYPHAMTPPTFNWPASSTPTGMPAPPPQGSPSATPKPAGATPTGPLAASGGGGATMKRTPGAPNLGYYQGNNNRFIGIAQPNASPQNSMRAGPQATALNLAGMFGGRGQPAAAVNPNAPAANAQPVSMVNGPTPVGQGLNPSGNLALTGGNSPGPNQFSSVPVPLPPKRPPGLPYWPFKQQGYSP